MVPRAPVPCHPPEPCVSPPAQCRLSPTRQAAPVVSAEPEPPSPGQDTAFIPAPAHPPLHHLRPESGHPSCTPKQGRSRRTQPRGSGPSLCATGGPILLLLLLVLIPPFSCIFSLLGGGGHHPKTLSTPLSPRTCHNPAAPRGFLELPAPGWLNGAGCPGQGVRTPWRGEDILGGTGRSLQSPWCRTPPRVSPHTLQPVGLGSGFGHPFPWVGYMKPRGQSQPWDVGAPCRRWGGEQPSSGWFGGAPVAVPAPNTPSAARERAGAGGFPGALAHYPANLLGK